MKQILLILLRRLFCSLEVVVHVSDLRHWTMGESPTSVTNESALRTIRRSWIPVDEEIIWSIVFVVAFIIGVVKLRVCSVGRLSTRIIKRMPRGSYTFYEGVSQRIDGELVDGVCFESVEEICFCRQPLSQCCLILFCLSCLLALTDQRLPD